MIKTYHKLYHYTLLELVVSSSVFLIIVLISFKIISDLSSLQQFVIGQSIMFENANLALELMTREMGCIYKDMPFWHWAPKNKPASWHQYRNELIAFISSGLPNNKSSSKSYLKIKYQKYYSTNHKDDKDGWLRRSVTGNCKSTGEINNKWNIIGNYYVGYTTLPDAPETAIFTANSTACEDYQKVIPNVIDISFLCYDKKGNLIPPTTFIENNILYDLRTIEGNNQTPYFIYINLILMDKFSWIKWISLGGQPDPNNDTGEAKKFRLKHQRSFQKVVIIR